MAEHGQARLGSPRAQVADSRALAKTPPLERDLSRCPCGARAHGDIGHQRGDGTVEPGGEQSTGTPARTSETTSASTGAAVDRARPRGRTERVAAGAVGRGTAERPPVPWRPGPRSRSGGRSPRVRRRHRRAGPCSRWAASQAAPTAGERSVRRGAGPVPAGRGPRRPRRAPGQCRPVRAPHGRVAPGQRGRGQIREARSRRSRRSGTRRPTRCRRRRIRCRRRRHRARGWPVVPGSAMATRRARGGAGRA